MSGKYHIHRVVAFMSWRFNGIILWCLSYKLPPKYNSLKMHTCEITWILLGSSNWLRSNIFYWIWESLVVVTRTKPMSSGGNTLPIAVFGACSSTCNLEYSRLLLHACCFLILVDISLATILSAFSKMKRFVSWFSFREVCLQEYNWQ